MDLRSKLELYKSIKSEKITDEKPRELSTSGLNGDVISNDDGECYLIENCYYNMYLHGGYPLSKAQQIDISKMDVLFRGVSTSADIRKYLFLDTETTGLSGGVGTVAFLVGIGYFVEDTFYIKQYFMRDFDEEPSLLRELGQIFSQYEGLITFNGKCFDWNLLLTRFAFNRMKPGMIQPLHVDLLFPARRLWKHILESCRLSSLEENILGEFRTDDIPGAQIPAAFFKYLDDRNTRDIKRIIEHNRLDILSMVSLLIRISDLINAPLIEYRWEEELFALSRIYLHMDRFDLAKQCLEKCIESDNIALKDKTAKFLAGIYKRKGNYPMAVEYWTHLAYRKSVYSMIELAKYYEHKEKDINKALEIVESAMVLVRRTRTSQNTKSDDLIKRFERLKRKAGRM